MNLAGPRRSPSSPQPAHLGLRHDRGRVWFAEPFGEPVVSHPGMNARTAPPGPGGVGIGLRSPHVAQILAERPAIDWLEVHAENYMGGEPALRALQDLCRDYPISVHGVGLSLGSADGLDSTHLERLAALVERVEPALVSEHLSWSVSGGAYLNHLLPLPYTEETLALVSEHVRRAQDRLGRRLLVENPSSYLRFRESPIPETEFLDALARRTGCGLLCDVNNIHVTCRNLGEDPVAYLDAVDRVAVGEIHLAGHAVNDADGHAILIDDHGSRVAPAVWQLYARALARFGPVPTLVEWDTELPALAVLAEEAETAAAMLRTAARGEDHADAA
jgi:uncharacterized protein